MKFPGMVLLVVLLGATGAIAQTTAPSTAATAPAVPKGQVTRYTFDQSKIFPGTVREYSVYVPEQYDPAKSVCVFVDQDGVQFNAPAVFDQLIASHEMPVTVGIFITPGVTRALADTALSRFNRSFEYDSLGDNYARFLLDELIPHIVKEQKLNLSTSGNDRCIAGTSSGAICAFTAAWDRPDAFSRVFSGIGTYVGLRGGNVYPTLIRKYEPKPIRIYLQDGSADQNIYGGDWWMANQEMERALTFAGYEVNHDWGDGPHNAQHATRIFADAMRWIWKGWPEPIKAGLGSAPLQEVLLPNEKWRVAAEGLKSGESIAVNAAGEVFFSDSVGLRKIGLDGKVTNSSTRPAAGLAFGSDGRMFATEMGQTSAATAPAATTANTDRISGKGLVARRDGSLYVAIPPIGKEPGKVCLITPSGEMKIVDEGEIKSAGGITLSTDQSLLYVADGQSHWVYSYQIQPDGTLANKQKYYHLHMPDTADDAGAGGMCVDTGGRLYVATRMGIQICDQAGRVNCIVPTPNGFATDVCFGGANFDTLYAVCGDKVLMRKLKVKGVAGFQAPIKPTPPRL